MTRLLVLTTSFLAALPLVLVPAATAPAAAAPARVELGGVPVELRRGTTQVVTVDHTSGHHARVVLWERRSRRWRPS